MLPLPQEYKVKGQRGFIYKLLKRTANVAMAEQIDKEDDRVVSIEVFVIQKYPDRMSPDGKTFIPAKEAPPRSELWGAVGFSCANMVDAQFRYDQLCVRYPEIPEVVPTVEEKVRITKKEPAKKATTKKKK